MRFNVYCPLCGIILLPDPYNEASPSSQTERRPWYAEARGVHFSPSLGTVSLTGLGIIRRRNRLYAPLERSLSYIGANIEELGEFKICEASDDPWCFGFHDSCWVLLVLRVSIRQDKFLKTETQIAQSLFRQLNCIPCIQRSIFQFGHDYEGATQMHKSLGRPNAIDSNSHFYADPCNIPLTAELGATGLSFRRLQNLPENTTGGGPFNGHGIIYSPPSSGSNEATPPGFGQATAGELHAKLEFPTTSSFEGLSPDLTYEILSYLPFDQLLNLRLVCRHFATFGRIDRLPQSYWRSRFCIGQEADFIFPNLSEKRNWASLFSGTRVLLRERHLAMLNRKRIRSLLEPIADLLDLDVNLNSRLHGSFICPAQNEENLFRLSVPAGHVHSSLLVKIVKSFSGEIQSYTTGPLEDGCRAFHHRAQSLTPSDLADTRQIGVSCIKLGTRRFISGIYLYPRAESEQSGSGIGYYMPASERRVDIPRASNLQAIYVAFRSEGLTGIKFVFEDLSSTRWLGDIKTPGIAFGHLPVQQNSGWPFLVAGLDSYKIVSLGIGRYLVHSPDLVDQNSLLSKSIDAQQISSSLWVPDIPNEVDLVMSKTLPSQPFKVFEPLINIDFGGPKGIYLGVFTRITCHMTSNPYPLIGLEIFHADGRSLLYGIAGGCELSFFVNGQTGERIRQVGIVEEKSLNDDNVSLGGLQVNSLLLAS